MEIRLANKDDFEEEALIFRKIDINILKKVEPKWAYGKDADKIFDYILHPKCEKYIICLVRVADLMENVEFLDFDIENLFVDDIASDYRVISTLKRWMNNDYVDPPTLSINRSNGKKLSIADGRHRVKISHFLKLEKIPVAINIYSVEIISKIINLEQINFH